MDVEGMRRNDRRASREVFGVGKELEDSAEDRTEPVLTKTKFIA